MLNSSPQVTKKFQRYPFMKLYNALTQGIDVPYVVDVRDKEAWSKSRMVKSVSNPNLSEKVDELDEKYRSVLIITSDLAGKNETDLYNRAATQFPNLQRWVLEKPFGEFEQQFPFLTSFGRETKFVISRLYPPHVTGKIYLAANRQLTKKRLGDLKIEALINCSWECKKKPFMGDMLKEYTQFEARDKRSEPLLEKWYDVFEKCLDKYVQEGHTTIVHCQAGRSRSATLLAAYLMKKRMWTREKVLLFLDTKKKNLCPNIGFRKLLLGWEEIIGVKESGVDSLGVQKNDVMVEVK